MSREEKIDYILPSINLKLQFTHLPTSRVFPVKVQSVETELLDEVNRVDDELPPGRSIVHQSRVFVARGVIPPAQS